MSENRRPSQADAVLAYLVDRGSITPVEAAEHLGVWRLAPRIFELKERGYDIRRTDIPNGNGGRHARYYIRVVGDVA